MIDTQDSIDSIFYMYKNISSHPQKYLFCKNILRTPVNLVSLNSTSKVLRGRYQKFRAQMDNLTFREKDDDQSKNAVVLKPCSVKVEKIQLTNEEVSELKEHKNPKGRKTVPKKTEVAGRLAGVKRNKGQFRRPRVRRNTAPVRLPGIRRNTAPVRVLGIRRNTAPVRLPVPDIARNTAPVRLPVPDIRRNTAQVKMPDTKAEGRDKTVQDNVKKALLCLISFGAGYLTGLAVM